MRLASYVAAALVLAACGKERSEHSVSAPATCTRCHGGGDNDTGAPPLDGRGRSDTAVRSVGAHTAHVGGGRVLAPLGCEACHQAPSPEAPLAHVDGETRISLGIAARTDRYPASWDAATASCDVYCHGPTLSGGSSPRPVWTVVRAKGSPADCGACHGNPPPPPHPARTDCGACHPDTIRSGTEREIDLARGMHMNGLVELPLGCASCHGDPARAQDAAAPPAGTNGETLPSERGVGAHQAHLTGGELARAIACAECHVLPQSMTHADGAVDFVFGATARARNAAPRFDPATGTCASTYCHGATLAPGGTVRIPSWTGGPSQAACGSCHGVPPPSHGASATRCELCHPGTVLPGGGIDVNGGMHVNGVLEVNRYHPDGWVSPLVHGLAANRDLDGCRRCHGAELTGAGTGISCGRCHGETWQSSCTFCHGDPNRATHAAAPPEGTQNELATTEPAVGAHQAHLRDGTIRQAVACAECHAVPTDLSHVTGTPELTWGELARAGGAAPRFEGGSCAATYCHGATLAAGGTNQAPAWTRVDGTQAACGTCHGTPPPLPHPQIAACRPCHPQTIDAAGGIDVAGGMHVNGVLDRSSYHAVEWMEPAQHGYAANRDLAGCRTCHGPDLAGGTSGVSCDACHQEGWRTRCTFCHGDAARTLAQAAPPVGTQGQSLTTERAVGAHARHVLGGALSPPVACAECHVTPADLQHVNGTPALTWGPLARAHSAAPAFGGTTCSGVYCHGATLAAGGTNTAPSWTVVDGTQAACGTCHGAPPPYPHPQSTACGSCHPGAGTGTVGRDAHVNGTVDLSALACSACHGDPARALAPAAPPLGTRGESATTQRAVGAHQAHVQGSAIARPFDCDECHLKPTDLTHIDGTPAIVFGTLGGASALWNGATCSASYCHGATLQAGGAVVEPSWTVVDGTQAACGSCHGAPPPPPHVANGDCARCHDGYTQTTVNLATHVDGKLDLSGALTCSSCHGDASRPVAAAAPPIGTGGETATTQRAVGAHQAHVQGSARTRPFACSECHVTPVELTHADGTPRVSFGPLAGTGSAAPAWNGTTCASTYCHGVTLAAGGTLTAPSWTVVNGTQADCGTCHGSPPPYPHPQNSACGSCHPGAGTVAPARDTHVNGTLDLSALGCSSCHGDAARVVAPAAPPMGTRGETSTTQRAVGAHQAHVQGSELAGPFDCDECHLKPADLTHIDGTPGIVFGSLGGASGMWNGTTCASTYCHGGTLQAGGTNTEPAWTSVGTGQASCGSCHGLPPPSPHPAASNLTSCVGCHPDTMDSAGRMIPPAAGGKHLDGALQVTGGHEASWMDTTSAGFHAYSAGAGIASCQGCHGPTLAALPGGDCASCHGGSTWSRDCTMCHGGTDNQTGAPPRTIWGRTTDAVRVGAHTVHLAGGSMAPPFGCNVCHTVPTDAFSPGHVDRGTATVTFGGVAVPAGGTPAPTWTRTSATCASTYCHGATLAGGSNTAPVWTGGAGQASCGSCHGLPPPSPHPTVSSSLTGCATCHNGTVDASGGLVPPASGGKHLNGQVDAGSLEAGCSSCHGIPPGDGGPSGHSFHVSTTRVGCDWCHHGYTSSSADPAYHMNGTRDARLLYFLPNPDPPPGTPPTMEACVAPPLTAVADIPQSTSLTEWDTNVCSSCHAARDYRYQRCCSEEGAPGPDWCWEW